MSEFPSASSRCLPLERLPRVTLFFAALIEELLVNVMHDKAFPLLPFALSPLITGPQTGSVGGTEWKQTLQRSSREPLKKSRATIRATLACCAADASVPRRSIFWDMRDLVFSWPKARQRECLIIAQFCVSESLFYTALCAVLSTG